MPAPILFLSAGGLGFLPKMPGTYGSLGGLILALIIPSLWLGIAACALLLFSIVLINHLMKKGIIEQSDPSWIVIDEVVGQMIPFIFIGTSSWFLILLSFILFRFFDISKIGWVGKIERLCEKSPNTHALGVMMDDVVAGLFATGIVYLIAHLSY